MSATCGGVNSDSDVELDQHQSHHHRHSSKTNNNKQFEMFKRNTNTNLIQPTKKLTSKLISFLRKLRNETDVDVEEDEQNACCVDEDFYVRIYV